jgi:hypothetical protein
VTVEGTLGLVILIVIIALPRYLKHQKEAEKKRQMEEWRRSDPTGYLQMLQIEHEERMMEHDRRRLAADRLKVGVGVGSFILKLLTKR